MKSILLVLITVFSLNSLGNFCQTTDLDFNASLAMNQVEPTEDENNLLGFLVSAFDLFGCLLDSEKMSDLNMSVEKLNELRSFLERSFLDDMKNYHTEIRKLRVQKAIEDDQDKIDMIQIRIDQIREEMRILTDDMALILDKIDLLLASA